MKDWNGNSKAVYVTNGDSSHSTREREIRAELRVIKTDIHILENGWEYPE